MSEAVLKISMYLSAFKNKYVVVLRKSRPIRDLKKSARVGASPHVLLFVICAGSREPGADGHRKKCRKASEVTAGAGLCAAA